MTKEKYFVDTLHSITQRLAYVIGVEHNAPALTNDSSWPSVTTTVYKIPANSTLEKINSIHSLFNFKKASTLSESWV